MKSRIVKIRVPPDLAAELDLILNERKLSIEDAALLYLRSMVANATRDRCLFLSDKMQFGKFKGSTLETVIKAQPDYVVWLLTNSKSFSIEIEAMELLNDIMSGD